MASNVIVVAFDGMDRELVEEFGLENVRQEEFGSIDNSTGINYRYTSELFASFITGETWDEHGIIRLSRNDKHRLLNRRGRLAGFLSRYSTLWRLVQYLEVLLIYFLISDRSEWKDYKYSKRDLESGTLFDEIDLSKPLFVPAYNPDPRWQLDLPHGVMRPEETTREDVRKYSERLTESRLREFYDLNFDFWDFVMLHIHEPDAVQDVGLGNYERDYRRLDGIAEEIVEEFSDDWTIIFMSDHGMMEEKEHNENAFYSCNKELFGSKTPHITEFYDKIIELTDNQ